MVEVESHADEAKVLIWEVNHFGEELLHHRLFENEQSTNTQLNTTISYDCFIIIYIITTPWNSQIPYCLQANTI